MGENDSIGYLLHKVAERLENAGVQEPTAESELLLGSVLCCNRVEVLLRRSDVLGEEASTRLEALVLRREQRVPLQHLLGSVSFMGHEIAVSPAALIPRPETEILAERVIHHLVRRRSDRGAEIFDFGTGTGCLAVSIAKAAKGARVVACDISPDALALARINVAHHELERQIELVCSDGFEALSEGRRFDVIVSNPPYIARAEIEDLQPEVAQFDPRLALDGGLDGLDYYRRIAKQAPTFLCEDGVLMLEIGDEQNAAIQSIFLAAGWPEGRLVRDYSERERVLEFCR